MISTAVGTTSYQTLSFTQSGLTAGLSYKFQVSAVNIIGESLKSSTVSIIAASVPGTVATPTLYSQSKTAIGINWNVPLDDGGSPVLSFLVQMDGGSVARDVYSTIATVSNQATNFYVTVPATTPLVTGEIYKFKVIATNVIGNSIASASFSVMAAIKPSSPGTPTKITASTT